VNVYLNDEDIRYLTKDATSVKESDTVTIVPSVAGGIELADRASGLFE
jgi:adenylyltransferase/sulfurtransferase